MRPNPNPNPSLESEELTRINQCWLREGRLKRDLSLWCFTRQHSGHALLMKHGGNVSHLHRGRTWSLPRWSLRWAAWSAPAWQLQEEKAAVSFGRRRQDVTTLFSMHRSNNHSLRWVHSGRGHSCRYRCVWSLKVPQSSLDTDEFVCRAAEQSCLWANSLKMKFLFISRPEATYPTSC